MRVGIISDTHGLLRPEIFEVFRGVEHILHAGDIGPVEILDELSTIAPVTAVYGNTDGWEVRHRVPEVASIQLAGIEVTVVHGMQFGSPNPLVVAEAYPAAHMVVFGHSHQPVIRRIGGVLAVNPGSAGRQRFRDPVTCAIAEIAGPDSIQARLIELNL
jgi:uncharacterized protein